MSKRADPDVIRRYHWTRPAAGGIRPSRATGFQNQGEGKLTRAGRRRINVQFPVSLFDKIRAEAIERKMPVSTLVVELCEASVDGIA